MNKDARQNDDWPHIFVRCICGDDLMVSADPEARIREIRHLGQQLINVAEKYRDEDYLPSTDPDFQAFPPAGS